MLLLAALLAASRVGSAQEAVVLSGGGSRGLAHAGALVGLERLGHDPDYVVGASMGAVIGALYAAGYDPETIWEIVERREWREIFLPLPVFSGPERSLRYPLLRAGVEGAAPWVSQQGLVSDWRINRLLVRYLFDAGARARGDFDRLPRRYRAVATDLESGEMVVLREGDFARAARASMAAPGVFAPVVWRERVLVDGSAANYFPIVVARALGAERVIGVDVTRPPEEIVSLAAPQVAVRALALLFLQARPEGTRPDVLVLPPIDPTLLPFIFPVDATPLLRAGLRGALRDLAPAPAEERPAERLPEAPPVRISALRVEAPEPALEALARAALAGSAPGAYDPAPVLDGVDRLYATGFYDGVWPRVEVEEGEEAVLRVQVEPRPAFVAGGAVGYDDDRGGRIWATLRRRSSVGLHPVELALAGAADGVERWASATLQAASLRWPPLLWSVGGFYRETEVWGSSGGEVRRTGGWAGVELRRIEPAWAAVGLLRGGYIDAEEGASGLSVGPLLRVGVVPSLVRAVGVPAEVEVELRAGEVAYRRVHAQASVAGEVGEAAVAAVASATLAAGEPPLDVLPTLGGEGAVPGLGWGALRGRGRLVAGVDVARSVPRVALFRLRLRAGVVQDPLEAPGAGGAWAAGAELGALWWTPFGPIGAGVGVSDRGDWRLDVTVGPRF